MKPIVYLAPMSGVADLAFRLIAREAGAKHCFFEMIDSNAMVYSRDGNSRILKTTEKDLPISAQLVGSDPSMMFDAAEKIISRRKISFLDINSACPVKKIIKKSSGAALLDNTALLARIIKRLASGLRVPVTVKLRTGFDKRDVRKFVRIAKICEANGASTLFIHGRTSTKGYHGDIDYESIRAAKAALKIPVFGSGNIFNVSMAKRMFDETGCDGVLVARGALGNPWIFKDIENYLKTGKLPAAPELSLKKKVIKKHLAYIKRFKDMAPDDKTGFMGKVALWYLKGVANAKSLRDNLYRANTFEELAGLIDRA